MIGNFNDVLQEVKEAQLRMNRNTGQTENETRNKHFLNKVLTEEQIKELNQFYENHKDCPHAFDGAQFAYTYNIATKILERISK